MPKSFSKLIPPSLYEMHELQRAGFVKLVLEGLATGAVSGFVIGLFRISYTTSVDFLRARRRTDKLPDSLAEQAAKGRDPGISDEMRTALASLSVLDRAIVAERILMEMSYVEMADIHHLPAAALRKRYSRARQKLQKLLAKEEHHA